jgi:Fe-S cluster assembly scaffold protein SufB
MTQQATQLTEQSVRDHSRALNEPEWLLSKRIEAWRAFETMAMPTGMEEEWRRTDISGLNLDQALSGLRLGPDSALHIEAPEGVAVIDISRAAPEHAGLLREHLYSLVPATDWKIQALEAALWSAGVLVYVPANVEAAAPVHLKLNPSAGAPFLSRVLVVAESNSAVTVIQECDSEDATSALVAGAVEVVQRPDSRVRWFDIQRWGNSTYNFSTLRARLEQGAELTTCSVGLGGRLTKGRIEALKAPARARSSSA